MFKITLDKDKCIGCGTCMAVCPGNYEMENDGKAKVIKEEVESLGCNRMAEENCPVKVIVIKSIADKQESAVEEGKTKEEQE